MPAGDLLTADRQCELRATLFGLPTIYAIDEPGIKGLGTPGTKTADSSLDGADGSVGAPDFLDIRLLTIPIDINAADEASAMNALAALNDAWAPARDGVDLELHLQLAGWGHIMLFGRPRGVDEDLSTIEGGWIPTLCTFVALDPTIYDAGGS